MRRQTNVGFGKSNSKMGSVAMRILLGVLSCVSFTTSQQNGAPFAPAHATDYGYGGQVGPLTYNGHLVPDTVSDSAATGSSGSINLQPNPGQQPTNGRLPCSRTTATAKPCSTSKKRCWMTSSGKGVQLGPTGQQPVQITGQTGGQGQILGPGMGTLSGGGQNGQYGPASYGQQGQLGSGQPVQGHFPSSVGLGTGKFGTGGLTVQQPIPSINEHAGQHPITIGAPQGYKFNPTGLQQPWNTRPTGGGLQQGSGPIGTGQYIKSELGVGTGTVGSGQLGGFGYGQPGNVQYGGAGTPYGLGPYAQFGTGASPYGLGHAGTGQTKIKDQGQVGSGQPQTGSFGQGIKQQPIGTLGYPGGAGQLEGNGYGPPAKVTPWGAGQLPAGVPQDGSMLTQTGNGYAGGQGQGGISGYKIKQYASSMIGGHQPVVQQVGFSGQHSQNGAPGQSQLGSLGHSGQSGQTSTDYKYLGQTPLLPKFGMGHPSQQGQQPAGQAGGHQGWVPSQVVRYPVGTQASSHPHQGNGYPNGAKVKYPNGSQHALPSHQVIGSKPNIGYPSGLQVPGQQGSGMTSTGSHTIPQGVGYPTGSKIIVQQGMGQSSGSQVASQQGAGYPTGPQIISQQAAGYPGTKIVSQGYPSFQIASQQTIGYPSGHQVTSQQWVGYPSGAQAAPHAGATYPDGSKPKLQHGIHPPSGSQVSAPQGTRYPMESKFPSPQGINLPIGQAPFHHVGGYPTGPQAVPPQGLQYPIGSHSTYTKNTGTQQGPPSYIHPSGSQNIYPHSTTGQLQGGQFPQYPGQLPGGGPTNGQAHGQHLRATLHLQPAPPGFRYSIKPK